jgi:hypothetical protein
LPACQGRPLGRCRHAQHVLRFGAQRRCGADAGADAGLAPRSRRGWSAVDHACKANAASLPPAPPLRVDTDMLGALSRADRALGRLDGASEMLPNPDLFVYMPVRKAALLSSQIEDTEVSVLDPLEVEAEFKISSRPENTPSGRAPR